MGWAEWVDFQSDYDGPFPAFHNNCGRIDVYPDAGDGDVYDWSPATDYAAAFEVVERMRGAGWTVYITGRDGWTVEFSTQQRDRGRCVGTDLPRAICEAALQAKRKEQADLRKALGE